MIVCDYSFVPASVKLRILVLLLILGGCANLPTDSERHAAGVSVVPFSVGSPGKSLPAGWQPWIISRYYRDTMYRIVEDGGSRVLEAHADSAASGLLQELAVSAEKYPLLSWRWRGLPVGPGGGLHCPRRRGLPAPGVLPLHADPRELR